MKLICIVFCGIILGLPVYFHMADSGMANRKTLVCCELVSAEPDRAWDSRTVLMFDFFENGGYDVLVGHPPTEGNCGSATVMRSGVMNEDARKALWAMAKDYPHCDQGFGAMRNWSIATNSVLLLSEEAKEMIRFAVTNAAPNGTKARVDGVHPLAWCFWGEANSDAFYNGKEENHGYSF